MRKISHPAGPSKLTAPVLEILLTDLYFSNITHLPPSLHIPDTKMAREAGPKRGEAGKGDAGVKGEFPSYVLKPGNYHSGFVWLVSGGPQLAGVRAKSFELRVR